MNLNMPWLLVPGRMVSTIAVQQGVSHITISMGYRELSEKEKISSEQQFLGENTLLMPENDKAGSS